MLPGLLGDAPEPVRLAALRALGPIPLKGGRAALLRLCFRRQAGSCRARAEALRALERLDDARLGEAVGRALDDRDAALRVEGHAAPGEAPARRGAPGPGAVLENGQRRRAAGGLRRARRHCRARLPTASCRAWLDRLGDQEVPPEIELDLLEAARRRTAPEIAARLRRIDEAPAPRRPALRLPRIARRRRRRAAGGRSSGRRPRSPASAATRSRQGGRGRPRPDRHRQAHDRRYLLESIVAPNRQIAKGFETLVIATSDGQVHTGILKEDDGTTTSA